LNVLTAVHVAYALDQDRANKVKDPEQSALDLEYLTELGLTDQLPSLRRVCAAEVN
jgi:hypothetical protein